MAPTLKAQPCNLGITTSTDDSKCKATGSITVNITNGSGQYNYIVTGGTYTSTTSSNIISGLKPGFYTVKVKDIVSGCQVQKDSVSVGGNYQDPRFQLSVSDVSCINGSNGIITVSGVQYGKAPFSYAIVAPSASGIGTTNSTGVFTGLIPGDYSVQLSDSCGGLQTRVITVSNYNWFIDSYTISKIGCVVANANIYLKDNKGNVNTSGSAFNGFLYGVVNGPGDTTWSNSYSSYFFIGSQRTVTLVVKDNCGNVKFVNWNDTAIPTVNTVISTTAFTCSGFTASVTGQSNLTTPQYCLYDNLGNQLTCNTTGQFANIGFGSYCIKITDNCYDTVISRCFTVSQPVPSVSATVTTSNMDCSGFTATVSGQQNLFTPQYCIKDSVNNVLECNSTGVFNNLPYGPYCITITDGCSGSVITRCFIQRKLKPAVAASIVFTNAGCTTVTASISGQTNITNGQYCIYDVNDVQIACNTTGVFNNLPYGSYCMHIQNDAACYDTTILRCFTASAPVPSVSGTVSITAKTCTDFTASIAGQLNLTNPQYCLYDNTSTLITCNTTGQFTNLAYGAYCIQIHNDGACFDTTLQRCFSVSAPVPAVGATVNITNKACTGFTAAITGQANLTTPQYCLYDNSNTLITCNATGQFDNVAYGSYCIKIVNTCYDTTITRCFTVNPVPIVLNVTSTASCTIGTTTLGVTVSNGVAPYTINVYNPGGMLVSTTTTASASATIAGLTGLPVGSTYKIVVLAACGSIDSTTITPVASSLTRTINANSKCPGGLWQNGSGDLLVNVQFSGGTAMPTVIKKDGAVVNITYTTQSGSNFTFSSMEPATYIIKYTLQGCATLVYDTFNLKPYNYPTLDQSAVYQCNNNNFSVSAAATGGTAPFTYEIIGSLPASPSIIYPPQGSPTFAINNGTTYSVVRLRVIDACGNATINDASILPLGNTIVKASSDCFYNNVSLTVDTIPNATYLWYKKSSAADSSLIGSSQDYAMSYLLPSDTGTYVSVVSVNSGCLTKISTYHVTGLCGGLLAVNGLSFEGNLEKDNVQLKWITARAFDAVSFVIERSTDGSNFNILGTVGVSSNNSISSSQYLFSDVNAAGGKSFYRLRIVQSNGKIAYTNVIEINRKSKVAVSVMPNPVAESFSIKFQPTGNSLYNVALLSVDGKTILNNHYSVRPGDTKTIQRPGMVSSGVYYLVVLNQSTNEKDIIKLFFK
ncbi:MAG: hypothetical protein ABI813_03725 [Bacteroidota bacterium]